MNVSRVLLLGVLACSCSIARAHRDGIYAFTDERDVAHLSNLPSHDSRYRLVHGGGSSARLSALPAANPQTVARYAPLVREAARRHNLEEALLHAVIRVESGYNPVALSVKGAAGMMQLLPATAQRYGARNLYDPGQNIQAGAHYLRDLLDMFDGNVPLALAAYNAGEMAVKQAGNRVPRFPETVAYVAKVVALYEDPAARR
jgi:soluble lytic murein transglycosylase-like protein